MTNQFNQSEHKPKLVPARFILRIKPNRNRKTNHSSFAVKIFSIVILAAGLFTQAATAEIIVTVDLSNPAAAVIQTTGGHAEAEFIDTAFNGITLHGFFAGNTNTVSELISGGIEIYDSTSATTTVLLDRVFINSFSGGFTPNDLTFFGTGNENIYSFLNRRAVSGCAVYDLIPFSGLPANGTTGDVYIGEPNSGQVIGQWQIADAATMITMVGDTNPSFNGTLSPWDAQTLLEVGINSNGTVILDGAEIQSIGGNVGSSSNANATGQVTVSGAGSHWNMSDDLNVGLLSNGTIVVDQCGILTAVDANIGSAIGSNATANVSGNGSQFNTTSDLTIGDEGTGQFTMTDNAVANIGDRTYVGYQGTGTLNVTDSSINSSRFLVLGDMANGDGTATFDSSSLVISGGLGSDLIIGRSGLGQMFLQNGSSALVATNVFIGVTANSSGDNRLEVSNESSLSFNDVIIHVGQRGNGTLLLDSGSTIIGRTLSLGSNAEGTGVASFTGENTTASLGFLFAGANGTGDATVSDGAQFNLNTFEAFDANLTVGDGNDAVGTVTVTGVGSSITANKRAEIGGSSNAIGGTGTINIESAATLTTIGATIGLKMTGTNEDGGIGIVNVTGTDSIWTSNAETIVGGRGEGHLNILDGGTVSVNSNVRVGEENTIGDGPATVTVSGTESTFNIVGELSVGDDRAAIMTIENGAVVNSGTNGSAEGIIGDFPSADGVLVTIDNATWNHLGSRIKVGADGGSPTEPTTLRVINGGKVNASGLFMVADDTAGSNGIAEIIGVGSAVFATDSVIGDVGTGTLNVLDGGSLTLNGVFDISGSGTGRTVISGAGSTVEAEAEIAVGRNSGSTGTLTIENGGTLISESQMYIGEVAGSIGTANVDEGGSLIARDQLVLSTDFQGESDATLNIDGGNVFNDTIEIDKVPLVMVHPGGTVNLIAGSLNADQIIVEGEFNFSGGTLIANFIETFDEQFFQTGGTLAPATSFTQTGSTAINSDYFLLSSGSIEFDIEGASFDDEEYDFVFVGGNAIVEGTMKVNLNGYAPVAGDTFNLLSADGQILGSPTFDFEDAVLGSGLQWDTGNFLTDGMISVFGGAILIGDVNCDGVVDLLDVQPFVTIISSGGFSDKADINQDGVVNLLDIDPFVSLLSGN